MKLNPNVLRKHILDMVYKKQSGHIGGSFSICDIIAYLYSNFNFINKDKLILSKGHAVPAIYAALYELGYIDTLDNFREINSPLQGHPDKNKLKYIHATTGSLGQGLSIAIGHAIAMKLKKSDGKVFCILGDGELQEGQVWEAFMSAPKFKLDNLVCIIDYNGCQSEGFVEDIMDLGDLREKICSFGWVPLCGDGHDMDNINWCINIFEKNPKGPKFIIFQTTKGKGVSFMENNPLWHSRIPTEQEYNDAIKELNDKICTQQEMDLDSN
jgi:transketolase